MSRAWLEAAAKLPDVEIVGLADIDTARAAARAKEFSLNGAVVAPDAPSLIAQVQPDLLFDVVVPGARHGVVRAALEAGCHVLSEKPMAESMDEARDLLRLAREKKRIHAIIQNRRYLPSLRRIARAVKEGLIGDVTSLHADFFLAPHFGGFREEMAHVLLLDMAIHTFDAARCMSGLNATGVYAREWNPVNSWYRQGPCAAAIFDMQNGAVFTYRGSWCAEGLQTSWESAWRLVGSKGTLTWDGGADIRIEVGAGPPRERLFDSVAKREVPALAPDDAIDGHAGVIAAFVAAVKSGRPPETSSEDNIHSLAMTLGAIASAEQGRYVSIE